MESKIPLGRCRVCGYLFSARYIDSKYVCKYCKDLFEPYPKEEISKHYSYRIVRALYYNSCAYCGFNEFVEVHHIKPRKGGGRDEPNNLILLCPNHHRLVHKGVISEQDLLQCQKEFLED